MVTKRDLLLELCAISDELSELRSRVEKLEKRMPAPKKAGRPRKETKK